MSCREDLANTVVQREPNQTTILVHCICSAIKKKCGWLRSLPERGSMKQLLVCIKEMLGPHTACTPESTVDQTVRPFGHVPCGGQHLVKFHFRDADAALSH